MRRIEDLWQTPGPRPNGLQAAPDGLWVIDAENSHLYKLDYETGQIITDVPTDTYKPSGLTVAVDEVWVASTHNSRLYRLNKDGSTIEYLDPPGVGVRDCRDSGPSYIRPHGMEYLGNGTMWVSIKPALRNYLVNASTLSVIKSIPTPGSAPHGIAWDGEALWCGDRAMGAIHKLHPETGEILEEILVPDPEVHGLTIHNGSLLFCCDPTRRVCRIAIT